MLEANRKSPPCFLNRLRGGFAAVACLLLSGTLLGCHPTSKGALDAETVDRLSLPIDADPDFAERLGREALAKIGYIPIMRLAREAGWVTTKRIESTSRSDPALLAQSTAARAFVEVFSKYAVVAGVTSQADSPLPGPADAVAIGILVVGLIDAGLLAYAILDSLEGAASPIPSATTAAPPAVTTAPVASAAPTVTAPPVATTVPITGAETDEEEGERCEKEWDKARQQCRELLKLRTPPRGLTGGYVNVEDCARGFVSQDCGGNVVDLRKRSKRPGRKR